MVVTFSKENITKFSEGIILNPVNCGELPINQTAIELKKLYPENQTRFDEACSLGKITPDKPHIVRLDNGKCIINVSNKDNTELFKSLDTIVENFNSISDHCGTAFSVGIPVLTDNKWDLVKIKIQNTFLAIPTTLYQPILNGDSQQLTLLQLKVKGFEDAQFRKNKKTVIEKDAWKVYVAQFSNPIDKNRLKLDLKQSLGVQLKSFMAKSKKFVPKELLMPEIKVKKTKEFGEDNTYKIFVGTKLMRIKGITDKHVKKAVEDFIVVSKFD